MADKMLRIAGRDDAGLAKAIKTDSTGNIGTYLTGSKFDELLAYQKRLAWAAEISAGIIGEMYSEGVETLLWDEGYALDTGLVRKDEGNLYLEAKRTTSGQGDRAYVTKDLVDLTLFKKIYIEWENTGDSGTTKNRSVLSVSTVKLGQNYTSNKSLTIQGSFGKQISTLNVASLVGSFYVRPHAVSTAVDAISALKVYRIWGEK